MVLPKTLRALCALCVLVPLTASGAVAADGGFSRWVSDFWPAARSAGVSRATFERAFRGVSPDPEVLEKARYQPEFAQPIWTYLARAVSDERIANGRAMLERYRGVLDAIEGTYKVDRHVLVAIWGMESSYGEALTNPRMVKPLIRSLATLAYEDERRGRYARTQLVAALKLLERGDVDPGGLTGSWAGAMGHTQFIPTTFEAYGVDFDGDGHRNIWQSPADALASAANYLHRSGWVPGKTWGYEVALPRGFDFRLADSETELTLAEWERRGIRRVSAPAFPRPDDLAILVLPAGAEGPAFLMLRNHFVIRRYNNALAYALAVGHLADRLRGGGPFEQSWPVAQRPLNGTEREELQRLLADAGYYEGSIDGQIGPRSVAAIRAYQTASGLTPDGHAAADLLDTLRGG
ncbi:lytic murein transglycosylase [Propylenella binzhouense]|uniref:Lytic murein transglycosylase n=1 Tax=Propylenella binzhouense TaxID=2555902 RepID=A0A964T5H4_9HYPH|nr:lytic murein transglycosylase [Propylenella binzhouense]MYZ48759.1 lytic murein transglycosylase [Propylenella binzhouense]